MSSIPHFLVKTFFDSGNNFDLEEKMDNKLVGKFIKELRMQAGLSQEELGEKLLVTNKTVSRWETGEYLPPVEVLESMGVIFDVTLNELLSGKRLSLEEYKESAEKNLRETIKSGPFSYKEKIDFFKKKWLKEHVAFMVMLGILLAVELVFGVVLKNILLLGLFPVLVLIAHVLRYNRMMSFAEGLAASSF